MNTTTKDRRSNRCPQCGHSYNSAVHLRRCKGLTRAQIKAKNRARNARRQSYRRRSPIDWGRVLSRGPVADGAFYEDIRREREAQEHAVDAVEMSR